MIVRFSIGNVAGSSPTTIILTLLFLLPSIITSATATTTTTLVSSIKRLPKSLTSLISAESTTESSVTTATLLTSRSVERLQFLQNLFSLEEEQEEEQNEAPTALIKNGLALAIPPSQSDISTIVQSVFTCGGSIVYVVDMVDLVRGEGLFDELAPVVECLLMSKKKEGGKRRGLVVVAIGGGGDMKEVERLMEGEGAKMLSGIIQEDQKRKAMTLGDVFDDVKYVSSSSSEDVEEVIGGLEGYSVEDVMSPADEDDGFMGGNGPVSNVADLTKSVSPQDIAAAWVLSPASEKALESAKSTVRSVVLTDDDDEEATTRLVPNFGELCTASVSRAMEEFDEAASSLSRSSSLAKKIRVNLSDRLHADFGEMYETQLQELRQASFESFKKGLSGLRLTANLANDMERVASTNRKQFETGVTNLRSSKSNNILIPPTSLPFRSSTSDLSEYRTTLSEYITLRLQTAKADGKFRPAPRKGTTVGLHWLLPKPFGNDYRQEPWEVHSKDNLIYSPVDKITDVDKGSVKGDDGDWRRDVVPNPSGNEMLYMQ